MFNRSRINTYVKEHGSPMRQDISFMKYNIKFVFFFIVLIVRFTKFVTVGKQSDANNRTFDAVAGYKIILLYSSIIEAFAVYIIPSKY